MCWAGGERGSLKERDPGGGYVPTSFLLSHKNPREHSSQEKKGYVENRGTPRKGSNELIGETSENKSSRKPKDIREFLKNNAPTKAKEEEQQRKENMKTPATENNSKTEEITSSEQPSIDESLCSFKRGYAKFT